MTERPIVLEPNYTPRLSFIRPRTFRSPQAAFELNPNNVRGWYVESLADHALIFVRDSRGFAITADGAHWQARAVFRTTWMG